MVDSQPPLAMRPNMGHIDPPVRRNFNRGDHARDRVAGQLLARQHIGHRIPTPPTNRVPRRVAHPTPQIHPPHQRRMTTRCDRFPPAHRTVPPPNSPAGRHRQSGRSAETDPPPGSSGGSATRSSISTDAPAKRRATGAARWWPDHCPRGEGLITDHHQAENPYAGDGDETAQRQWGRRSHRSAPWC